ncbi:type II secretion system F family protein [Paenibacillaceae bacterium T2]|uniref:Type II secretion system F family protein n=2 Tax=Ferviditalea candida TaxID=3108399 RepID=A0ABU5ZNJ4_9BACL|nr:type II secretion system F family protein [Paenibacillaceae bacterium T2]
MVIHRCSLDEADGIAKWMMAETMLLSFLVHDLTLLLAVVDGSSLTYAGMGLLLSVIIPYGKYRDLEHKWIEIKRSIVLDLPELLDKLTLLVNAGETVQGAIARCAERRAGRTTTRLYQELAQTRQELANRISFHRAMEDFSKRCSAQEVSIFTTTILMNYRRGGDELVAALRELSRDLWEKRKAAARIAGEEASSKLVFPMIIIFIVVMVVIVSPAVMIMSP